MKKMRDINLFSSPPTEYCRRKGMKLKIARGVGIYREKGGSESNYGRLVRRIKGYEERRSGGLMDTLCG